VSIGVTQPSHRFTEAGSELSRVTTRIRTHVINMCSGPAGGHLGGCMSLVEILAALYFCVMNVDPARPEGRDRDMLILSKGHGAVALYATLAEAGFFPSSLLDTYGSPGSRLMSHPHADLPGVEMPSGSLGHGLALGLGIALAHRLGGDSDRRTFVVMGDGELQEGSVWEAAAVASHQQLDRLTAIVDRNELQITGGTETVCRLEPLAGRWAAFGWNVIEADGHDVQALADALTPPPANDRPTVVIAHTIKGKGVARVQGQAQSHFARLSEVQRRRTLALIRREEGQGA
jgi:transketolase